MRQAIVQLYTGKCENNDKRDPIYESERVYFHQWAVCNSGSMDGFDSEVVAIVEDRGGAIHEVPTHKIKFIDAPK